LTISTAGSTSLANRRRADVSALSGGACSPRRPPGSCVCGHQLSDGRTNRRGFEISGQVPLGAVYGQRGPRTSSRRT
jgi:hypothetical protein